MALRLKILDQLIETLFEIKGCLAGDVLNDYILAKRKTSPNLIEFYCTNIKEKFNKFKERVKFCFHIEQKKYCVDKSKTYHMILIYKFDEKIKFNILFQVQPYSLTTLFDIDHIYMKDKNNYYVGDKISLVDIINQINQKKFTILNTYKPPEVTRVQMTVKNHSPLIYDFVRVMHKTCVYLDKGWKLKDQKLEDVFNPCLITSIDREKEQECLICSNGLKKYEIKLHCCGKIICTNCAMDQIVSRYDNTDISCPFCRGDLFNWKSAQKEIASVAPEVNDDIDDDVEEDSGDDAEEELDDDAEEVDGDAEEELGDDAEEAVDGDAEEEVDGDAEEAVADGDAEEAVVDDDLPELVDDNNEQQVSIAPSIPEDQNLNRVNQENYSGRLDNLMFTIPNSDAQARYLGFPPRESYADVTELINQIFRMHQDITQASINVNSSGNPVPEVD